MKEKCAPWANVRFLNQDRHGLYITGRMLLQIWNVQSINNELLLSINSRAAVPLL